MPRFCIHSSYGVSICGDLARAPRRTAGAWSARPSPTHSPSIISTQERGRDRERSGEGEED
eukprot:scaffold40021_cov30-Tisochrysis_lutea.AAC.5